MRVWRISLSVFSWIVLALLATPALVVIPLSFSSVRFFSFPPPGWSTQWYSSFFMSREWHSALGMSLGVGALSTIIAMVLGTLASLGLARTSFRGKDILVAALLSPLMMPTIILAIGLYFWFVPFHLVGSPIAIALGHAVLGTPFVIVTVMAALERFDPTLERAALSLGANPLRAFWFVTLPIIRPAFLSGAFLAFLASFDELVIALFLSGSGVRTLQIQMWRGIRFESDPTIAAVSALLIFTLLLGFGIVELSRSQQYWRNPSRGEGKPSE